MSWHAIQIPITELCIDTTLRCGQSFRWKQTAPQQYSCAIYGRLITLKQDATTLYYKATLPPVINNDSVNRAEEPATPRTDSDQDEAEMRETRALIKHYLNLAPNLGELYASWSEQDKNFAAKAPKFHGVRILKQDAWEALVGFICSSCNNIKRISQMMDKLCANYGPLIGHIDGVPYYDMPSPSSLINPRVQQHLRELGFGYRAAYLYNTAQMITRQPSGWLDSLRNPENPVFGGIAQPAGEMLPEGREGYQEAHTALQELQGVGAKVADCVCLFGLGWGEAVPVDTHVWQIAQRDYGFGRGKHKSLTKATYDAVAKKFRNLWGKEAGWAHSVLFTADLRDFAERLAGDISVKPEFMVKPEESVKMEGIEETPTKARLNLSPLTIKRDLNSVSSPSSMNIKTDSSVSTPMGHFKQEIFSPNVYRESVTEEREFITPKQEVEMEVKQEIVTPIRSRKRSGISVIKKEQMFIKTEVAQPEAKRRRSGRIKRES